VATHGGASGERPWHPCQWRHTERERGGEERPWGQEGSQERDRSYPLSAGWAECERTAQFIQVRVQLSPFNMLTRTYFHLYRPGSPPSVTKDLGKSTSQPRSHN
jgi:hypothetical protein